MTPRSAGAHAVIDPPAHRTLRCLLGWHRPTVVLPLRTALIAEVRRWTCPCQRFVWLYGVTGTLRGRFRG